MLELEGIKTFRKNVYANFSARGDASMNLLDALSSYGQHCNHVVELSDASCFDRQYSSITDAIADGLSTTDWKKMEELIYKEAKTNDRVVLIPDCTPNARPFSRSLADRHVTHYPNPAPGNKPICIGHQYAVVGLQPNSPQGEGSSWLLPLLVDRVSSDQKGNEFGMAQISGAINELKLHKKLVISIGDSLYGTEVCRQAVSEHDNWVHIFRLNSKRNVYAQPEVDNKRYGQKMQLNHSDSHINADEQLEFSRTMKRGKEVSVSMKIWNKLMFRGSRLYKGYKHSVTVYQVCVTDSDGTPLYKRPLWLCLSGSCRNKVSAEEVYDYYVSRYDIEHYFRFGKDKLLMDAYQTPEVSHEQNWWKLCALAYAQLYLARNSVPLLPRPWERYLPSYRDKAKQNISTIATPTQTQRGFSYVLTEIGTPARSCKPRGNPQGRAKGEIQSKRKRHDIKFKKVVTKKSKSTAFSTSEKSLKNSDPQTVEDLIKNVTAQLVKIKCSAETFARLLQNSS